MCESTQTADDTKTTTKLLGLKQEDYEVLVLAASAIGLSILYNLLQESMFTSDAKQYTALITMMTSLVYAVCALFEFKHELYANAKAKAAHGDGEDDETTPAPKTGILESMKGTAFDYARLGTLTAAGMYFTNWSLQYLNYTLRVLFKASKILPTIAIAMLFYNKKFSLQEFINILVLVASIVLFSYGDAVGKGNTGNGSFDVFGIVLITVGVIADALTSNFEGEHLFKTRKASHSEVMMAASLFGSFYMLAIMAMTGKLMDSWNYLQENPDLSMKVVVSCAAGYFSVTFILKIIKRVGAVTAEIVKSVRRVVSIGLSFAVYHKPFLSWHLIGSLFFVLFIYNTFQAKVAKQKAKDAVKKAVPLESVDLEIFNKGKSTLKSKNGMKP
eukprot:CAMPEP_0184504086 /NCGR_PEP_ID=MMETSP0113_2-20130426/52273_1 /TAXON_ID=91329 /ORGANISM="Norrisiella sphaerica, Strain BC52" /LENGTH=386 /DNA_ID=CAMNT_0026893701 /DNA_START=537 /DNA_END=1697 /DNA_ORIENTATION=-